MVNGEQDRIILFFKRASMWTLKTTDMPNPQIKQNKQTYDVLFGCPLTNGIRVQAFFAFEWFLTQLETSLSISHESRSKPLTRLSTMLSKKFHVYLGALRRRSATDSNSRARWAGTKKWTRSIQLGIFQPNNQSGLGPLFHHAHLSHFLHPGILQSIPTPRVQQIGHSHSLVLKILESAREMDTS